MMFSGELRRCSSNPFCLVRLLSVFSVVCGLRTEHPPENLPTLPTTAVFQTLFPSSAWMPVAPGSGQGSFVGIRQTEGTQAPPHSQMETARHEPTAGGQGASFADDEVQDEPSSSAEETAKKRSRMKTSWIEVAKEVHNEESGAKNDEAVLGKGKTAQELTDEDLHRMTPREGLVALLSQGKDLVADVKGTLDGIDAVVSLGRVTQKIRDEIQKDVQALNRTIVEEFDNIEQLRKLQEAQTAVLRSQLSFLMPKHAAIHGEETETAAHVKPASAERTIAALPNFWNLALLTAFTIEIGASIVLK